MTPEEYARAVRGFADLPTGAGQNHIALADFLNDEPVVTNYVITPFQEDYIILYPLNVDSSEAKTSTASTIAPRAQETISDAGQSSGDERRHEARRSIPFTDAQSFFRDTASHDAASDSCILFLRGFMTANWINNVGARYVVDPELFCRHLDFRPSNDSSNNFSTPTLPSSSWHLIELPVITIGTRVTHKGPMRLENIELLRKESSEALDNHHHNISKLSSSSMNMGESMLREFYVFDETHFAMEQRISISIQPADNGNAFTCESK